MWPGLRQRKQAPLGYELRTFRFCEGVQPSSSLFFSHVTSFVGRIFRGRIDYRPFGQRPHPWGRPGLRQLVLWLVGECWGAVCGVGGSLGPASGSCGALAFGPISAVWGSVPRGISGWSPAFFELLINGPAAPWLSASRRLAWRVRGVTWVRTSLTSEGCRPSLNFLQDADVGPAVTSLVDEAVKFRYIGVDVAPMHPELV